MRLNSIVLRSTERRAGCCWWLRLSCYSSYLLGSFMRVNWFTIIGEKGQFVGADFPFITILHSLVGDFIFRYQSSHFGLAKAFPQLLYFSDTNEGGLHTSDLVFFCLSCFGQGEPTPGRMMRGHSLIDLGWSGFDIETLLPYSSSSVLPSTRTNVNSLRWSMESAELDVTRDRTLEEWQLGK